MTTDFEAVGHRVVYSWFEKATPAQQDEFLDLVYSRAPEGRTMFSHDEARRIAAWAMESEAKIEDVLTGDVPWRRER